MSKCPDKRGSGKTITTKLTVRPDRQLCSLFFCQKIGCSASFENANEFELHMVAGVHQCSKLISSMDRVKNAFETKMKWSSQFNLPLSKDEVNIADMSLEDAVKCFPIMGKLNELGWALPIRSKFRFNYIQKKLLYGHFIEGEKTGKKMSPEQVEKLLRKALNPDQYVTVQQIKSLYSRWAKLLKDGQLEEPKEKENIDTDEIDQGMDNNDDEDTDEESYAKAIQEQVIIICDFSMLEWTVVLFYKWIKFCQSPFEN